MVLGAYLQRHAPVKSKDGAIQGRVLPKAEREKRRGRPRRSPFERAAEAAARKER